MIPVIDFTGDTVLDEIRDAYTTVGFAVFTNTLSAKDQHITSMGMMHDYFTYRLIVAIEKLSKKD